MKDFIELDRLDTDLKDATRIFRSIGLLFMLEDLHMETIDTDYIDVLCLANDDMFEIDLFKESDLETKQRIVYNYFQASEPDNYIKKHKFAGAEFKMKSSAQREVIQKIWQERRLPGKRVKSVSGRIHHNKTTKIPWSLKARDLHFSGESVANALVLEHAKPIHLLIKALREVYGSSVINGETMYQFLLDEHSEALLTIITKEEDRLLTSSGSRDNAPKSAWERYEVLGGKAVFLYLEDDSRYSKIVDQLG